MEAECRCDLSELSCLGRLQVTDERERARLSVMFSSEREEAKARILALSSAAQAPVLSHC